MILSKLKRKKGQSEDYDKISKTVINLVKDLNEKEKKHLIESIELAWKFCNKISQVENGIEPNSDIDKAEKILTKETKKRGK